MLRCLDKAHLTGVANSSHKCANFRPQGSVLDRGIRHHPPYPKPGLKHG
jgi:hypothetical protein